MKIEQKVIMVNLKKGHQPIKKGGGLTLKCCGLTDLTVIKQKLKKWYTILYCTIFSSDSLPLEHVVFYEYARLTLGQY